MKQQDRHIVHPINPDKNPMVRGQAYTRACGEWPVEFLSPQQRRNDTWLFVKYYGLLGIIAELASGTFPFLWDYREQTYVASLIMIVCRLRYAPAIAEASLAILPLCLVPPWFTEWAVLRNLICWFFPFYAAYQFRRHLIEFVSAAPLPPSEARAYRENGVLPSRADSASFCPGAWKGFWLGVTSWITYLGNEQQLPSVFRSPAGVWHSRTFVTTFGVFGCSFLFPPHIVLVTLGSLLAVVHPVLAIFALPVAVFSPVLGMGALAFLFSIDRLASAWSLKQYAKLENTFADLVTEISSPEATDA